MVVAKWQVRRTYNSGTNDILRLTHDKVKTFFLKNESYCSFDLPIYTGTQDVWGAEGISGRVKFLLLAWAGMPKTSFRKNSDSPLCLFFDRGLKIFTSLKLRFQDFQRECEKVNYLLLSNKDGKFAWRPFELIHPALYVALVHKITEKSNWELIIERFEVLHKNDKIKCLSMPVESISDEKDKAAQITHWWHAVEQKSIVKSIKTEP
jgi:hypothetical protein